MPETLGQVPEFAEVEPYLPSSSFLAPGAGQASVAGPGAQAGVFGMDPSWWVACQVSVEQLCQMGSQWGVPPASRPWASCSLVTCLAAGTEPRDPRGPWGGRRQPQGPPRFQQVPGPGAPDQAAFRVPLGQAGLPGPRQRRRRQGSKGAAGTRPRHGPTSLRPVLRCSDLSSASSPLRAQCSAIRDFTILIPGSGVYYSGFRDFLTRNSRGPCRSALKPGRP